MARFRMAHWPTAVLVLVVALLVTPLAGGTAGASSGKILIYGPSLLGSPDNEQTLAQAAGYDVTVADEFTWSIMTTSDFAQYNAIVFGDPSCTYGDPSPLSPPT